MRITRVTDRPVVQGWAELKCSGAHDFRSSCSSYQRTCKDPPGGMTLKGFDRASSRLPGQKRELLDREVYPQKRGYWTEKCFKRRNAM